MTTQLESVIRKSLPDLVKIRHYIHQHPEICYEEVGTAALVERELRACGVEVRRIGRTGVVGLICGRRQGRTVALRADMDALPIVEETGLPYASVNGRMHACGHDGHSAILIGVARVLSALRAGLRGNVKLFFQPAEEAGDGALMMCDAGVMDRPKVDAVFALHGFPDFPLGSIATTGGPVMAACDAFRLTVIGRGAHGAYPQYSVDPVVAAARIVDALQGIVSREVETGRRAVVTVATIHGGTAVNIIPDRVEMSGTIRSVDEPTRAHLHAAIGRIAVQTARAHRATCKAVIEPGYAAVVNDEAMSDLVRRVAVRKLGEKNTLSQHPTMGAEDFSYYLRHAPGCIFRLGIGDPTGFVEVPRGTTLQAADPRPFRAIRKQSRRMIPLHNSRFDFNDKAIPVGVRMLTEIAREFLRQA